MRYLLSFTFFILLFTACGPLEFTPSEPVPKVMACNFLINNTDDVWHCQLTKIKPLGDSLDYRPIRKANISVDYNNTSINSFGVKELFRDGEVPAYDLRLDEIPTIPANSICTLNISQFSFPDLQAIDTMPAKPLVTNVITTIDTIRRFPSIRDTLSLSILAKGTFSFDLNINEDTPRYYMVVGKLESNIYSKTSLIQAWIHGEGLIDTSYLVNMRIRFDDELISDGKNDFDSHVFNQSGTVHISGSFWGLVLHTGDTVDNLFLDIMSISPSYYRYRQALHHANKTNNNIFSTPVDAYNNTDGGYGVFALGNTMRFEME